MTQNAFELNQGVPAVLVSGDLWQWRIDGLAVSYPHPDFTLSYRITPQSGGATTTATAVNDSDGWVVSVLPATTALLLAGDFTWSLLAGRVSDGARVTVCEGALTVKPDPAVATDTRTQARKHLDAINSVLDGRITKDVEAYSIEGRSLTRIPFETLHKMRARYMAEVQQEDAIRSGKPSGPRYRKMRF